MSSNNITERRRFSRIPFQAQAHIKTVWGELHLNCDVIDVSLNGILITKPDKWNGQMNDSYQVDLLLENGQLVIKMGATVAHIDQQSIGFTCENIDLDSITHLKRLVELNLGDEELLHRELSALIH
ncbi:MAG: PilZ domain-containing protein [Gammaproteobacteria bacterium]|nr:MAG: PilZ domain-containing protein [Gammaproteobacteria bacterium]